MKKLFLIVALLFVPLQVFGLTCTKYVDGADGVDSGAGDSWSNNWDTIDYAFDNTSAGDVICVDEGHTESSAVSILLTSAGTFANPVKVVVVQTGTQTPVTSYPASAIIDTTTVADAIRVEGGSTYFYGVHFKPYDGLWLEKAGASHVFENSKIDDVLSDVGSAITCRASYDALVVKFINVDIKNGSLIARSGCRIEWLGGSYESTGIEHSYLIHQQGEGGDVLIDGVDLSPGQWGTAIIETATTSNDHDILDIIQNSKLPASITYFSGQPENDRSVFEINGSGNADEYWMHRGQQYAGSTEFTESVDRTGGSTYDGTSLFSLKMTTNGNAVLAQRCVRKEIGIYGRDLTSTKTYGFHIAYDSATQWENDEFFLEARYQTATDQALGAWVRGAPEPLIDTPDSTEFSTTTETWNGTSGWSNERTEKVSIDIPAGSPNAAVSIYANFCKPSETIYLDLSPDVT